MIAAIYARKSTEQKHADAEAKSVARQIENARAFAKSNGWRVDDAHVYSDDGISGAAVNKLVNRQRLLDALDAERPPFQVLVLRDASRFSRRDGDEAFGELKRIAQRGVEIHFYQEGTRFTFGTLSANVIGFMTAEMNAEYRRQIARFTTEAMLRKARAGHVPGGVVFGYDNVRVNGHTERRINDEQAAAIRRVFALSASGMGFTRIARMLNAERVVTPRPKLGRRPAWAPSTVKQVLYRSLYRGMVVWNRTERRPDGTRGERSESAWVKVEQPELRIVSDDVWRAAHARLDGVREQLRAMGAVGGGRRRDSDSRYLLSGLARCGVCGGSIGVMGTYRHYGCVNHHKRGGTYCSNSVRLALARLDEAVLAQLHEQLGPKVMTAIVDGALAALAPKTLATDVQRNRATLQTLDREIARLATAIAQGGQLTPLLDLLKTKQTQREELIATIDAHAAVDTTRINRSALLRRVRTRLDDWRDALSERVVARARQALRDMLTGPLVLTPDGRTYRFAGEVGLGQALLGEAGLTTFRLSSGCQSKGCTLKFSGKAA